MVKKIFSYSQKEMEDKFRRYKLDHPFHYAAQLTKNWDHNWRNKYLFLPESQSKDILTMIPYMGDALDAGYVYTDINRGNYGKAAVGLGLLALPNVVEKPFKRVGKKAFNLLGEYMPNYKKWYNDAITFLKTPIDQNPIKVVKKRNLYKHRWDSPKVNVGPYNYSGVYNSQENALELLRQRIAKSKKSVHHSVGIPTETAEEAFNDITHYDYVPYKKVSELADSKNPFVVIPQYIKLNLKPGVAIPGGDIYLNTGSLKKHGLGKRQDVVRAHEVHHFINTDDELAPISIFNTRHLSPHIQEYLNHTELAARGSQLKNYFGFTDPDQKLTGDMLKYAAEHYKGDVFDNNMQQMFSSIKDWDAAAEWFNTYSYKTGGKLIKKYKNE